jgi:hypothetical protein
MSPARPGFADRALVVVVVVVPWLVIVSLAQSLRLINDTIRF